MQKRYKVCVVGLGYVGLPLAVEFSKICPVKGFDKNERRIEELEKGFDKTLEVPKESLDNAINLTFTSNLEDIQESNFIVVTVPTPIDKEKNPDLSTLISASQLIGSVLKEGDIVVYESTVYPGATEEVCVPILEKYSSLKFNKDFFVGYSPERINPGDKKHSLRDITKITSGSTDSIAEEIDQFYSQIIDAGTHKAESIKVAEAAKVIENTQRDINIALMNELTLIFNAMDIDTEEVLRAAETKWNFLPFKPGLVGGHCIGVDPYYLTHKSKQAGYHPEIILAGRKLNDTMSSKVSSRMKSALEEKDIKVSDSNILVMGLTFKENCPDLRNSKSFDLIEDLIAMGCNVDCLDPYISVEDLDNYPLVNLVENPENKNYDGVILAVAHNHFKEQGINKVKKLCKEKSIIFDLKYLFSKETTDLRM
tara:strand:- start:14224 stop:15495 length:1272 start_codon:yes stop_codon:yes gene_type:complete